MESGSMAAPPAVGTGLGSAPGDKGLKTGALGFVSSVVIGVASTAPGYSLAASLGFVVAVAGVGLQAPAILIVAFIPMLLIASAYYYMNRADPDCGTTFSWVTRALGPHAGWIGGWAIIVADIIVMANLAQIAGLYSFLLFGWQTRGRLDRRRDRRRRRLDRGHDLDLRRSASSCRRARRSACSAPRSSRWPSSRSSRWSRSRPATPGPTRSTPASRGSTRSRSTLERADRGVLLAVFIYWGWDSPVTVNEETEDANETPGQGGRRRTLILLGDLRDRRRSPRRRTAGRGRSSTTPTTCSACSARRSSARRWTRS